MKKLIQLFWVSKKAQKSHFYTTAKERFLQLKRQGIKLFSTELNQEYTQKIEMDSITKSILDERYKKFLTKTLFILFFIFSVGYILMIKSELYESRTELIVKDLQTNITSDTLGLSLLGVGSSSQFQDSKTVEAYLKSIDIYQMVDQKFHLTEYYKSDALDLISRLSEDATQEEVLAFYNQHLLINYDELSGILSIAFSHTNNVKAKQILHYLVQKVEEKINEMNQLKAKQQLAFVEVKFEEAKKRVDDASRKLEAYQDEHLLMDPKIAATSASSMIAELEAKLMQDKIKYATMLGYLKEDNYELKALKKEIEEIGRSIKKEKKKLVGGSGGKLNKVLFEYEKLKLQLEFETEVYKSTLIQLETTKIDVVKNSKTLSILSKPNLPDGYTYPDKPKMFVTLLMMTLLFYGIVTMLSTIIRDHKE